jgi:hypothetical protein
MRGSGLVLAAALLGGTVSVLSAPVAENAEVKAPPIGSRPDSVREIASDTLADVAMADYGEHGSVIYYNPAALEAVGPDVGSFLMAHERGHIHLKHTRANALLAGKSALDSVLQGRELAADCYAARTLGPEHRAAVIAAVRFFGRLGSVHFDAAHPSGAQRAATILSCLPADSVPPDSGLAAGEKR